MLLTKTQDGASERAGAASGATAPPESARAATIAAPAPPAPSASKKLRRCG